MRSSRIIQIMIVISLAFLLAGVSSCSGIKKSKGDAKEETSHGESGKEEHGTGQWAYEGDAGKENPFIRKLWTFFPDEVGYEDEIEVLKINALKLLPKDRSFYHYMGSLTKPPATEGVKWFVMETPIEVSMAQVEYFSKHYSMNARPVQALNSREIVYMSQDSPSPSYTD